MTAFATLDFTREIRATPERLFRLMSTAEGRAAWSAPDDTTEIRVIASDIRPGGVERAVCIPMDGPEIGVVTTFHVIDAPARLICTETLEMDEPLSVALVTQDIATIANGVRLTVTIQMADVSGEMEAGYREGWTAGLDKLARIAEAEGVPA